MKTNVYFTNLSEKIGVIGVQITNFSEIIFFSF